MTHTSHRPGVTHLQLQMFLSHTAPCSFHWGLSIALNQCSCAIVNFDLWGSFCFQIVRWRGSEMRERTGDTYQNADQMNSKKSLKVWLRFTVAAHCPCIHIWKNKAPFLYSLGYKILQRHSETFKRITQIEMPPHCRGKWKGRDEGGGKKEKVSTSSSSSHFYKSMRRWGSRREEA